MKRLFQDKINPLVFGSFYGPLYFEFMHLLLPAEKITGTWPKAMTILGWLDRIKRITYEKIIPL